MNEYENRGTRVATFYSQWEAFITLLVGWSILPDIIIIVATSVLRNTDHRISREIVIGR
jgi:hypothetical protein